MNSKTSKKCIASPTFRFSSSSDPTRHCIFVGCQQNLPRDEKGIENCKTNSQVIQGADMDDNPTEIKRSSQDCIVGYQLPEFSVNTIDDKTIVNEYLMGNISIINFWFETCPPCIAEIPGLNYLQEKYSNEEVNLSLLGYIRYKAKRFISVAFEIQIEE